MNILLSDYINHKFIRNLSFSGMDNLKVIHERFNKNIYELYYRYNFKYVIFDANSVDNSIYQFMIEFSNEVKSFIFFHTIYHDHLKSDYGSVFRGIFDKHLKEHSTSLDIVLPDNYINKNLYKQTENTKEDYIVSFLEPISIIPDELANVLYPKSSHKIRLFNNPRIGHIQNLGMINEMDKAVLLSKSKAYINLDPDYINEALFYNNDIIDIKNLDSMKPTEIKAQDTIEYTKILKEILQ